MGMTMHIQSFTVTVADQQAAVDFYVGALGFELARDVEIAGARWVEVAPPGSSVSLVLLPYDTRFPVGVRLLTDDASVAFSALKAAGVAPNEPEVLRLPFAPPMFTFDDPDGNVLVVGQRDF